MSKTARRVLVSVLLGSKMGASLPDIRARGLPGQHATVAFVPSQHSPQIQLPESVTREEVIAAQMLSALSLPETALDGDSGALSAVERAQVASAMARAGVGQGGYVRHSCGYMYAIGECGGAMERARCPG